MLTKNIVCIRKDILATLAYFDMFDYPLQKQEIFKFLQRVCDREEFDAAMLQLLNDFEVFIVGDFYSLRNEQLLATRRMIGNKKAAAMLKKAEKAAAIISRFPFVRGVAVSGSLSKNFADDAADIDFFIITTADRLWISRTFLHLFKKLTFLFKLQHYFCMNYFIDESKLTIIEKNIYTATEIVTLMPLEGKDVFVDFYNSNSWVQEVLPNNHANINMAKAGKSSWLKVWIENLFQNKFGSLFDDYLMKLTIKSWQNKTRKNKRNSRGVIMGMHADKHFSKPDPANFQQKLLIHYENSLSGIADKYEPVVFN